MNAPDTHTKPAATTVTTAAWAAPLQDGWAPGDAQRWHIPVDVRHPSLGLSHAQMTETLQEAGILPADWDETYSHSLALAAQSVLSREIGTRSALRGAWISTTRSFVSTVMAARTGQPVVFEQFADAYEQFRRDSRWGWGNGERGVRRVYEYAREVGGIAHVDPHTGPSILPVNPVDYAPLDEAWVRVRNAGGARDSYLPLLPIELISCFAPTRRLLTVTGVEAPAMVPSLIEIVAVALVLGSGDLVARGDRMLDLETLRPARKRRDRKAGRPEVLSYTALRSTRSAVNAMLGHLQAAAVTVPQLRDRWLVLEPLQKLDRNVRSRVKVSDRTGVPLTEIRIARAAIRSTADRLRQQAVEAVAAGSDRRDLRYTTWLRLLIILDLACQLGIRPGEGTGMLRVSDIDPAHVFNLPEGPQSRPAVHFRPSKDIPIASHWRGIHEETAEAIAEWVAWMGLTPRDWLIPAADPEMPWASQAVSRAFANDKAIPLPDGTGGYQLSRLRHTVEQIARMVGTAYIAAHDHYTHKVDPQVFSDAICGHVMSQDKLGYKDLEDNRELWAYRAAFGDPAQGVPGVIDYMMGDAGAPRGWDIAAIRGVLRAQQSAQTRLDDASAKQDTAQRQLDRCAARLEGVLARPPALDATGAEVADVLACRDAYDHELRQAMYAKEAAQNERDRAKAHADDARRDLERAAAELEQIKSTGKSLLLAEDLREQTRELEQESWEEALHRADALRASAATRANRPSDGLITRIRAHLNLHELAAILDISDRAVRLRYENDADELVVITDRVRCVAVDRLPASITDRMTQGQHELMQQMLMVEMGSTRWRGLRIDNERIRAAEQAAL